MDKCTRIFDGQVCGHGPDHITHNHVGCAPHTVEACHPFATDIVIEQKLGLVRYLETIEHRRWCCWRSFVPNCSCGLAKFVEEARWRLGLG